MDHSELLDKVYERLDGFICDVCNEKFYYREEFVKHEHTSRGFATPLDSHVGPSVDSNQAKTDTETFDLTQIPYSALTRLGTVFLEGQAKYGKGNWKNGVSDKEFQLQRANHALKHLLIYIHELSTGESLGVEHEDNLAKVAWFCVTQMELQRLKRL